MSRTLVAIVAVLAVFAVLYLTLPQDMRYDLARTHQFTYQESNGILGRFMDDVENFMVYPIELLTGLSLVAVFSAGMIMYWRSMHD
jgi:hypothetical protein